MSDSLKRLNKEEGGDAQKLPNEAMRSERQFKVSGSRFKVLQIGWPARASGFGSRISFGHRDSEFGLEAAVLLRTSGLPGSMTEKLIGTGGGGRTHTLLRVPDFESSASANSATPAMKWGGNIVSPVRL